MTYLTSISIPDTSTGIEDYCDKRNKIRIWFDSNNQLFHIQIPNKETE
ncbi:hypothetical protein ACFLRZ_03900 [Bacteroidota bacterium]